MARIHTASPVRNVAAGPRSISGVSLMELVVTVAILAMLMVLALPSYRSFVRKQGVTTTMHLLASHLASARVSAITYRAATVVCPSDGQGSCRDDSDWTYGWLMFRDPDGNLKPDAQDDIYRNDSVIARPGMRLLSSAGRKYLRYLPDGRSAGSNLTIRICLDDVVAGQVIVNNTGRIRSARSNGGKSCAL